ncbi:hypothetical protein MPER_12325 [Moniliophthora perniciosa FA553]|nr:hypothetical protein MPER_12325 [Moniliophthora perniciosa FA553]
MTSQEALGEASSNAFTLKLPDYLSKVHPVFHVSQLEPFIPSEIHNWTQPPPPPVEINDEGEHYKISEVLDSKLDKQFCRCSLRYYVQWSGYEGTDEEFS